MIPRCPPPDPEHVFHQRIIYCAKCNFAVENQMAKLDSRVFHPECFVCTQCRESLVGVRVHVHNNENYCERCFLLFGTKVCDVCYKPINGENEQFIKKKNKNFHYDCYVCSQCSSSLSGKRFHQDGNKRICQACVAANRFAPPPSSEPPVGEEL